MKNFNFEVELKFNLDIETIEKEIERFPTLNNKTVKLLFDSVVESKDTSTLFDVYISVVDPVEFLRNFRTKSADNKTYEFSQTAQLMNKVAYLKSLDFQGMLEDKEGIPHGYFTQYISYENIRDGEYAFETEDGVIISPPVAIAFCNINESSFENAHLIELIERTFDYHYNGEEPDVDDEELDVF